MPGPGARAPVCPLTAPRAGEVNQAPQAQGPRGRGSEGQSCTELPDRPQGQPPLPEVGLRGCLTVCPTLKPRKGAPNLGSAPCPGACVGPTDPGERGRMRPPAFPVSDGAPAPQGGRGAVRCCFVCGGHTWASGRTRTRPAGGDGESHWGPGRPRHSRARRWPLTWAASRERPWAPGRCGGSWPRVLMAGPAWEGPVPHGALSSVPAGHACHGPSPRTPRPANKSHAHQRVFSLFS